LTGEESDEGMEVEETKEEQEQEQEQEQVEPAPVPAVTAESAQINPIPSVEPEQPATVVVAVQVEPLPIPVSVAATTTNLIKIKAFKDLVNEELEKQRIRDEKEGNGSATIPSQLTVIAPEKMRSIFASKFSNEAVLDFWKPFFDAKGADIDLIRQNFRKVNVLDISRVTLTFPPGLCRALILKYIPSTNVMMHALNPYHCMLPICKDPKQFQLRFPITHMEARGLKIMEPSRLTSEVIEMGASHCEHGLLIPVIINQMLLRYFFNNEHFIQVDNSDFDCGEHVFSPFFDDQKPIFEQIYTLSHNYTRWELAKFSAQLMKTFTQMNTVADKQDLKDLYQFSVGYFFSHSGVRHLHVYSVDKQGNSTGKLVAFIPDEPFFKYKTYSEPSKKFSQLLTKNKAVGVPTALVPSDAFDIASDIAYQWALFPPAEPFLDFQTRSGVYMRHGELYAIGFKRAMSYFSFLIERLIAINDATDKIYKVCKMLAGAYCFLSNDIGKLVVFIMSTVGDEKQIAALDPQKRDVFMDDLKYLDANKSIKIFKSVPMDPDDFLRNVIFAVGISLEINAPQNQE
jgi:hypothetical protein